MNHGMAMLQRPALIFSDANKRVTGNRAAARATAAAAGGPRGGCSDSESVIRTGDSDSVMLRHGPARNLGVPLEAESFVDHSRADGGRQDQLS